MHVLMISMDTSILTNAIGNSRERHEAYGRQIGRISMVVCNRRGVTGLPPYESAHVIAWPTESRSYIHCLLDGYRMGLRLHIDQPVDLIASQDPFLTGLIGLALRRRLGAPVLMQIHAPTVENIYFASESLRNRVLQRLARWTLPRSDGVRVVNQTERLACIRHGVLPQRVCVAPVPTAIERFTIPSSGVARWREQLGLTSDTPVVVWVGRPVPVKDLPMLLRAFARVCAVLPAARLIIAGDTHGTTIPKQVETLGISSSVCLPGPIAHTDLPALYQLATVYAHSSYYEGLGRVMIEASAAGAPVVSTNTDGAQDIVIDGQTGILVPIGDDVAMSEALLGLLRDPLRARALGAQARLHITKVFDEARLTTRWIGLLQAVAEGNAPCAS